MRNSDAVIMTNFTDYKYETWKAYEILWKDRDSNTGIH